MKTFLSKLLRKGSPERNPNPKTTSPSTLSGDAKKGFHIYAAVVLALTLLLTCGMTAFAATDDPVTVVNNLSDFIFGLIRAIGLILLGFGIVQIGLSLKSHDPSQRANGFLTLAGGVIITFAKEILSLITGG
ncbi:MAG: glutamyl-tRNA amidotransferase [Eubacteriales bacterium]|nr:glutamyl-tRNA amidotransferase [Eubacteriales bacterium]